MSADSKSAVLPRAVRRALDLIKEESGSGISIADIAAYAGVPRRSLQRQFRQHFGKTIIAVLRDHRFQHARRELLRSEPTASVSEIAVRSGFTHLARFSAEYRRRYNELPSATLRRRAALPDLPRAAPIVLPAQYERPTLVVLPFEGEENDRREASGVREQIAIELTRSHGINVVEDARARYVLKGDLLRQTLGLRLTLRLTEAATGQLLWANSYVRFLEEVPVFEERVAAAVKAAMRPRLLSAEIRRVGKLPMAQLTAFELALRALPHVLQLERHAADLAFEWLERALTIDPHQPLALALASWCHAQRVIYQFTDAPQQERKQALQFAAQAAAIGSQDPLVLSLLGNTYNGVGDLNAAAAAIGRSLAFDGGSGWAWGRSGWIDTYSGRPRAAIDQFTIALELNPRDPLVPSLYVGLGCAHFEAGRYQEAIDCFGRALRQLPSAVWTHRMLCPAYTLAGRRDDARRSAAALQRQLPAITVTQIISVLPMTPKTLDYVAEGLNAAGILLT